MAAIDSFGTNETWHLCRYSWSAAFPWRSTWPRKFVGEALRSVFAQSRHKRSLRFLSELLHAVTRRGTPITGCTPVLGPLSMGRKQRNSAQPRQSKRRTVDMSAQLALEIEAPNERASPASEPEQVVVLSSSSNGSANSKEDALLRTSDVVRIVKYHRCTLYRWMRAGEFPQRHRGKGWKRSEIERWLASDASQRAN